jgi:hypothetical protein
LRAKADELASSATIMIAISIRTSILLTHAGRCLLWRAKFADEPRRNRWQLQRINPIALKAPKRGWPLTVNRHHHQHHQAAAVLASPGWIGLTHAVV